MVESKKHRGLADYIFYAALLIIMAIAIFIAASFIIWYFKPEKLLSLVIIDKTVPNKEFREHKSIMWIANNLKYENQKTKKPFAYDKDYYGFMPMTNKEFKVRKLPNKLDNVDMIYIADTLGVYSKDINLKQVTGEQSGLIYGGMEADEVAKIEKALNKRKLLVAEFNTFASPTKEKVRTEVQDLLGVEWTGWSGRYFVDLNKNNDEVPRWLIKDYEHQYKKSWIFNKPGFAFVKEDSTVFILEQDKDVGNNLLRLRFSKDSAADLGVRNDVKYYYWFEVVRPKRGVSVIADYQMDLTAEGKKVMKKHGLNSSFPAVTLKTETSKAYYFAGDFSDIKQVPSIWKNAYIWPVFRMLTRDAEGENSYFFWNVYYPMMKSLYEQSYR